MQYRTMQAEMELKVMKVFFDFLKVIIRHGEERF